MPRSTPRRSTLRRRWDRADHPQRRALIISVALDLLEDHGIGELTVRRIAQKLGVGAMTLYTYVPNQDDLRRELIRLGFEMLHHHCAAHSTVEADGSWLAGARAYLDFASSNPNLYTLLFTHPLGDDRQDHQLLEAGFRPLVDRVRSQLQRRGIAPDALDAEAVERAAIYWVGLHGLATLTISGRIGHCDCDAADLLPKILRRIAPD